MTRGRPVVAVCDRHEDDRPGHVSLGANVEGLRAACAASGRALAVCSYRDLLDAGLPADAEAPLVVLFFPYAHWNVAIEVEASGTYGGAGYLRALVDYLGAVEGALGGARGGNVLNPPRLLALARDKVAVKRRWVAAGVPTPPWRPFAEPGDVARAAAEWGTAYVKSRCSSNTKGISVMTPTRWRSNFRVVGGRLVAPPAADRARDAAEEWRFADVPVGDPAFLAALDGDDCFLEAGVTGCGRRLEARVWVLGAAATRVDLFDAPAASATAGAAEGGTRRPAGTAPADRAACTAAAGVGVAAAAALGVRFGVIDVLLDGEGGAWAVDAQAFPPPRTDRAMWMEVLAA